MRMPTVPTVVTIKNKYNCRRSITMATYFQSSRVYTTTETTYHYSKFGLRKS